MERKLYERARINALQLEEHKGRGKENYDATCKLCGEEIEDIIHFIAKCKSLESKRNYNIINKEIVDHEERTKDVLYRNKNHNDIGIMIKIMWESRKNIIELQKKSGFDNQRNNQAKGLQSNIRLSNQVNEPGTNPQSAICPRTSPRTSPCTCPRAETPFSIPVPVQMIKICLRETYVYFIKSFSIICPRTSPRTSLHTSPRTCPRAETPF